MKLLKFIVFLLVMCMAVAAYAVNQEIQVDLLMSKIMVLLKADKSADALPYFAQLEGMESSLSEPLPESFQFYYIDTLDKAGDKAKALERANFYLQNYGNKGKNYSQVIEIMSRAQIDVDKKELEAKIAANKSAQVKKARQEYIRNFVNKLEDIERRDFDVEDESIVRSRTADYLALWRAYDSEIIDPGIVQLKKLVREREHMEAGVARDAIDLQIRELNLEIVIPFKRPSQKLGNLYGGMEKYHLRVSAVAFEEIRLKSYVYSRVHFETSDSLEKPLALEVAEGKIYNALDKFKKLVAREW